MSDCQICYKDKLYLNAKGYESIRGKLCICNMLFNGSDSFARIEMIPASELVKRYKKQEKKAESDKLRGLEIDQIIMDEAKDWEDEVWLQDLAENKPKYPSKEDLELPPIPEKCKHENKRVSYMPFTHEAFWFCPDCGEEVE